MHVCELMFLDTPQQNCTTEPHFLRKETSVIFQNEVCLLSYRTVKNLNVKDKLWFCEALDDYDIKMISQANEFVVLVDPRNIIKRVVGSIIMILGEDNGFDTDEDYEIAIKVVVVGNGAVGKSSMIQRFCKGIFTNKYKKTIGVDFLEKHITASGEDVRLMLWDTAGQEEFDAITRAYYRGAQACVIVFSTIDRPSFAAVKKWKRKVEDECGHIPMVLVQNKIDLLHETQVDNTEIEKHIESVSRWSNEDPDRVEIGGFFGGGEGVRVTFAGGSPTILNGHESSRRIWSSSSPPTMHRQLHHPSCCSNRNQKNRRKRIHNNAFHSACKMI
ncbi:RAB23 [Lepeophtheirus salmonis]|uniref:RAB23 n=2 Tax=Lepeophtheirus salmonis TaxID=72036 RepID=A0A7R8CVM6_LEPSM|nr:RAB23 [Lepeophtheirus salmonis]CAF2945983.1 RAB23 [Lepeophtheirus salmonis]